jgi:hypothetical protein
MGDHSRRIDWKLEAKAGEFNTRNSIPEVDVQFSDRTSEAVEESATHSDDDRQDYVTGIAPLKPSRVRTQESDPPALPESKELSQSENALKRNSSEDTLVGNQSCMSHYPETQVMDNKDNDQISSGRAAQRGNRNRGDKVLKVSPFEVPEDIHFHPFQTAQKWAILLKYATKIKVILAVMLLLQVVLVVVHTSYGFGKRSEHSKCTSYLFELLPITVLRTLSRVVLPGGIYLYFCFWVMRAQLCSVRRKFITEIMNPRNKGTANDFMKRFVDPHSKDEAGTEQHLRDIQQHLDNRLYHMVQLSCLGALVLALSLLFFDVFQQQEMRSILLGIVDVVSFGALLVMCGTVLSLLYLDGVIKQYFRQFRVYCVSKQLKIKAKNVDDCISEHWYPLNKLISILTVLYCVVLTISWASGTPLSCGISIPQEKIEDTFASYSWLWLILTLGFGQFFGMCPFSFWCGICVSVVETLILVMLYFLSPSLEWSQFTHVLYAIVPLNYLLWYHIMSIPRQWAGIRIISNGRNFNPDSRTTYWSRFGSRSALIILILSALSLSMYTEYGHIISSAIDKHSTALAPMKQLPPPSQWSEEQMLAMQEYIVKNCFTHPNSQPLDTSSPCLYLNPDMFKDKEMREMIAKTMSMVRLMWSVHNSDDQGHLRSKLISEW